GRRRCQDLGRASLSQVAATGAHHITYESCEVSTASPLPSPREFLRAVGRGTQTQCSPHEPDARAATTAPLPRRARCCTITFPPTWRARRRRWVSPGFSP